MTQEELREKIRSSRLDRRSTVVQKEEYIYSLVELINQHVKQVIGEDDNFTKQILKVKMIPEVTKDLLLTQANRNQLRAEQRKRAGL